MQIVHSRSTVNILKTAGILFAALLILLFGGGVIAEMLTVLFGGCVFSFLLIPLSRLLEKKLPRSVASLVSILGIVLLLVSIFTLLLPMVLRQTSMLAERLPAAFLRLRRLTEGFLERFQYNLPGFSLPEFNLSGFEKQLGDIAIGAIGVFSSFAGKLYKLFLMVVLSYFLMADREQILLRLELLIPLKWRRLCVRTGNMLLRELKLYIRGQATIALVVGTLAASALVIIDVPGALLLGLFVGVFNVIPYLGPFLGGIPAVITALSISWQKAVFTLLSLFLVQQIDGMVVSPRVMGNITGFSPAVVLLAIFVGARIGSISGMLFALPTLMAIRTAYRVFVQRHENN